jgi:hypothetical protein
MRTKSIITRVALAGTALGLLAAVGVPANASAGAPASLTVTPNPGLAGQTITVTPSAGCDGTEVELAYLTFEGGSMARTVTLDPNTSADDMWSDQLTFDAGFYDVQAFCHQVTPPPPAAGHLAVSGTQAGFSYVDAEFHVNGEIVGPSTALVGQAISYGPKARSLCIDNGTTCSVSLSMTNPDATATVPLAPTVDATGSWSEPQTFAAPGTYVSTGTCTGLFKGGAGHRAVHGISNPVLFSYIAYTVVVTAPTVETPPATPVVAAANFTG